MSLKLLEVTRGDIVEVVHRGNIAVVDSQGNLVASVGNPYHKTYFRSAAKPLQALNVLLSGAADHYHLTTAEIAIMTASHYAEDFHLETISSVLNKIGLLESDIRGGIVPSFVMKHATEYAKKYGDPTELCSDCSGKHSGMLSVCQYKNYDIKNYLDPAHPCQEEIHSILGEMCEIAREDITIGIDGCSAPVHGMPLYNMALGFSRIAAGEELDTQLNSASNRIFEAMNTYPEMVSGTNGFCSELIRNTNGRLIGKVGAEGVYCVGLKKEKLGIAIKIEDGDIKTLPSVVIETLNQLSLLNENELLLLRQFHQMGNFNDLEKRIGEIKPVFTLAFE